MKLAPVFLALLLLSAWHRAHAQAPSQAPTIQPISGEAAQTRAEDAAASLTPAQRASAALEDEEPLGDEEAPAPEEEAYPPEVETPRVPTPTELMPSRAPVGTVLPRAGMANVTAPSPESEAPTPEPELIHAPTREATRLPAAAAVLVAAPERSPRPEEVAPAPEVPAAEVPEAEVPVAETPGTELPPASEAPAVEGPEILAPVAEGPAGEAPVSEVPAVEVPAAEAPTAESVPAIEVAVLLPEAVTPAGEAAPAPEVEGVAPSPELEAPTGELGVPAPSIIIPSSVPTELPPELAAPVPSGIPAAEEGVLPGGTVQAAVSFAPGEELGMLETIYMMVEPGGTDTRQVVEFLDPYHPIASVFINTQALTFDGSSGNAEWVWEERQGLNMTTPLALDLYDPEGGKVWVPLASLASQDLGVQFGEPQRAADGAGYYAPGTY